MICPSSWKPCIDDVCRSGTCAKLPGEPPFEKCHGCDGLVSIDGSDPLDACTCDPEEDCDMRDYEAEQ